MSCAVVCGIALAAATPTLAQDRPADAAPAGPPAGKVLLIQESNGFPGGEQATALARQQVLIVDQRLRVFDQEHQWALFVSLPERKVQELSTGAREYVEHPFEYYEKYRTDRARALKEQAAEFTAQRERLKDRPNELRELEAQYTRMGGDVRSPGAITARIEQFPQDARTETILVDRKPREVKLEHYRIRENNASDPVFDLWITRDLALPVDVLAFWRALGTFAPAVSDKLQQVPGVVVRCDALLDTGTFKKRFTSRVLEIRTQDPAITAENTTLPAGVKKITDEELAERGKPAPEAQVWCVMTGRVLDPNRATVFHAPDGRSFYVADARQRGALLNLLTQGKEPPFLKGPAPSQPPGPR